MAETQFLPLPGRALPLEEGPSGYRLQRAGEVGHRSAGMDCLLCRMLG